LIEDVWKETEVRRAAVKEEEEARIKVLNKESTAELKLGTSAVTLLFVTQNS
jgi:hypothetical protein